jgi:uncharacterized membrane protein
VVYPMRFQDSIDIVLATSFLQVLWILPSIFYQLPGLLVFTTFYVSSVSVFRPYMIE